MSKELLEHAQQHFAQRLHCSLSDLLEPIDAQNPAGYCVKSGGVYHAIQSARREDDPRLPQGPWQHELKRADWSAVSNTAADNLRRKSKDLQLAAWLLEAQLHQYGFAGLAPTLVLMDELIRRFRQHLHPQEADGGDTHRANVLRWVNKKLLPVLKQMPLTALGQGNDYGWADRETAWRREQLKPSATDIDGDAPTLQAISAAMAQTSAAHHLVLQTELRLSLQAAARLANTVDECFCQDKPSLAALTSLLKQMLAAVESELHRRGLLAASTGPSLNAIPSPTADISEPAASPIAITPSHTVDRAQAYALLEQAANTLLQIDPHSPAPYLVQRAVQWGRLSTAELYQEVFIRMGGQLNIFELLGLQVQAPEAPVQ